MRMAEYLGEEYGGANNRPLAGERCGQPFSGDSCAAAMCRRVVHQLPSQADFVSNFKGGRAFGWGGRVLSQPQNIAKNGLLQPSEHSSAR